MGSWESRPASQPNIGFDCSQGMASTSTRNDEKKSSWLCQTAPSLSGGQVSTGGELGRGALEVGV